MNRTNGLSAAQRIVVRIRQHGPKTFDGIVAIWANRATARRAVNSALNCRLIERIGEKYFVTPIGHRYARWWATLGKGAVPTKKEKKR